MTPPQMLIIDLHQPPQHTAVRYNQLSQRLHCTTAEEGGRRSVMLCMLTEKGMQPDQPLEHKQTKTEICVQRRHLLHYAAVTVQEGQVYALSLLTSERQGTEYRVMTP